GTTVFASLAVARASESVDVTANASPVEAQTPTTQTTISRVDVQRAPGADRANSLAMITDFVPSATLVHDQLHVRGGHQVDWLIDGVPVPNTNIASNVGPQFDPRDVDYLETQRGGYSAEYGDRTYAVFNVVPRSGFERSNEAHLLLNYGSQNSTDDQFNFGSHSDRFAYYASASANRSNAGLEPPEPALVHDTATGGGVFGSLVFLPASVDQLRLVASARADRYEVPSSDDTQREHDVFINGSWLHSFSSTALLTIAPFVHTNSYDFNGAVARDRRSSAYAGAEGTFAVTLRRHDLTAGAFGFRQGDDARLAIGDFSQRDSPSGSVAAAFLEDRYEITDRLSLRAGARYTRFSGEVHENALTPRIGASFRASSHAILRLSYSDVYQPPPLSTATGPLIQFAADQGFGFLPLHGERDRELEAGVAIPVAGWDIDVAAFRSHARDFFDHDLLANSNIFFPLTIDRVFIRGAELAVRKGSFHVAFSHQTVEGEGGVTGGLTDFAPPETGRFFLDHDQRNTLSIGGTVHLPREAWIAGNLSYGSGFLAGDGPSHLPSHTTIDLSAGIPIGSWTAKLTALNLANKRYLLDESNTFGGTHWNLPRQVIGQIEYRFRY
ncbi:MAG TPA: TonB-dependent receptor, partial [Thermoanaerobaculia bacterium]|nr:TonB-dependent receptor [Thermoanaerobaculia bacterium]